MAGSSELYEHHDKAFGRLVSGNEKLETLYDKCRWAEGPVWFGDGQYLLWSDIPNDRIMRWTVGGGVSVFRTPAGNTNGHTRDRQGRLDLMLPRQPPCRAHRARWLDHRARDRITTASCSTRPTTWW